MEPTVIADFREELERTLSERPLPGIQELEFVRKHSEQFSEVFEYRDPSRPETPAILVKHKIPPVPPERGKQETAEEFENLEAIWKRTGAKLEGALPKPVAFLPELGAMVFEKLPGMSLEVLLKREGICFIGVLHRGKFSEISRNLGRWLRLFHELTAGPVKRHDSAAYLAKIRYWLDRCSSGGLRDQTAEELWQLAVRWAGRVQGRDVPTAGRHRDLIPKNVLVDGLHVAVIDFGGFREAEPVYEDLGIFTGYLYLMAKSPYYSRPVARAMTRAFLSGYGCSPGDEVLNLYVLKALLDMAACQFQAGKQNPKAQKKLEQLERNLLRISRRLLKADRSSNCTQSHVEAVPSSIKYKR